MSEKIPVSFSLTKETMEKLDRYAELLRMNRSQFLEWLLEFAYGRMEPNTAGIVDAFKEVVTMRKKVLDEEKLEKKEAKSKKK